MSNRQPYRRGAGRGYSSRQGNRSSENSYDGDLLSIRDIQHHFWQTTNHEDMTGFGEHATLNNSVANKDGLAYVLMFRGANPRWKSDNIIFVKSNLDILPDYYERTEEWIKQYPRDIIEKIAVPESVSKPSHRMARDVRLELEEEEKNAAQDAEVEQPKQPSLTELAPIPPLDFTPSAATPIAIFKQVGGKQSGESFKFSGWYTIQHVAIIAPYSEPLKRLLAQKWQSDVDANGQVNIKTRDEARWRESFEQEWAVVKFVSMPEGEGTPPALVVEKAPPRKSVNDLLAEMRLGKEKTSEVERETGEGTEKATEEKDKAGEEDDSKVGEEKENNREGKQEDSKGKGPEGKENEATEG
jgi:hypothetical protein